MSTVQEKSVLSATIPNASEHKHPPHSVFQQLLVTRGAPLRDEQDTCPICKEEIEPEEETTTHVICKYSFHIHCINRWWLMVQAGHVACPYDQERLIVRKGIDAASLSDVDRRLWQRNRHAVLQAFPVPSLTSYSEETQRLHQDMMQQYMASRQMLHQMNRNSTSPMMSNTVDETNSQYNQFNTYASNMMPVNSSSRNTAWTRPAYSARGRFFNRGHEFGRGSPGFRAVENANRVPYGRSFEPSSFYENSNTNPTRFLHRNDDATAREASLAYSPTSPAYGSTSPLFDLMPQYPTHNESLQEAAVRNPQEHSEVTINSSGQSAVSDRNVGFPNQGVFGLDTRFDPSTEDTHVHVAASISTQCGPGAGHDGRTK